MSVVIRAAQAPKFDLAYFPFRDLPPELRLIIWEFTADDPRYIEVVLKNGRSDSSSGAKHGYAFFKNPSKFHSLSPAGLRVCRESRDAILRFFSVLELRTGNAARNPDIEYVWMSPDEPEKLSANRNAKKVLFNPFVDTMVLQAGHVLHKRKGFLENIPQLKPLPQADCSKSPERELSPPIQHLATSYFPWDMSEGLPGRPDMMVEAFPELETLCIVGHRNDECRCGYCSPSEVEDPEELKKSVIETIEMEVDKKQCDGVETVCKVPNDVRVVEMNFSDPDKWWTGITDQSWEGRASLPDL